jgi:signal transduction histidine kinase
MFKKANIKLTLIYSLLFLFSFWVFSIGLYLWMENSLGESYINEIQTQGQHGQQNNGVLDQREIYIANIAGNVSLGRLRNILLASNSGLLIIIPVIAWVFTRRTMAPVQRVHDQQRQFVSDVAHELRTPLSIMTGEMEVTLTRDRTSPEYKQILASSKEEADHLTDLVENLLFLARYDQGKQVIALETVDLTDLIGGVIASLQRWSTEKKLTLHYEPEAEPTFVTGQSSLIKRLFFNLIHNAILYTPVAGNIWVSLSSSNQYTRVDVKDTGIGISPEDQEKLFNRFFRVDSSRSQTKGYGLGLAICQSIVELHHGKIEVLSSLGNGATFTVILPRSTNQY